MTLRSLLAIMVGVMLGACQPAPGGQAPSITISPTPDGPSLEGCALPCWAGIVPGSTTAEEAVDILEGGREHPATVEWDQEESLITWIADPADEIDQGEIELDSEGVVRSIYVSLRESMTAADALAWLGEPSTVTIGIVESPCTTSASTLFFPELHTELWGGAKPNYGDWTAESPVWGFSLYRSTTRVCCESGSERGELEWQGYQDYCEGHMPTGA